MNLQIMSVVYGEKHIEMWRRACLKSFLFPRNRNALNQKGVIWNFFTDEKSFEYVSQHIEASLPFVSLKLRSKKNLRKYSDPVQAAAIMVIEESIAKGSKLLMAPPDTIWGDGSVDGVLRVGREKGACVVVPHVRVLPSILSEPFGTSLSNARLVKMAWQKDEVGNYEHLHRSWSEAEVGHPVQNSFVGGVAWQRIDERVMEVRHRLPTVYLADFTNDDLQYFKTAISFGGWDHTWPGDILIKQGRQRFIGSSDLAFMAEITEGDKNVPPLWAGSPDDFWRQHPHNEMNKQFSAVFREE